MIEGFRFLPEYFSPAAQKALVGEVLALLEENPLYRPTMPRSGKPLSVRMTNLGPLGWISDISGYIRGGVLPMCPVDASRYNDVYILADGESPGSNPTVGTHAWTYNHETGDFHVNSADVSSDDVTTYDQF